MRWLRPWERMKYGAIGVVPSLRVSSLTPNAGGVNGGTAVTISGQGFYAQTDGTPPIVLFGTMPATSVVVVSGSILTCVSPAGNGTADVTVIVGVQSATLHSAFFYIIVLIQSIDPVFGLLTGGTRVLLTGVNFKDLSIVSFGGMPGTDFIFIDEQHVSCVTPAIDDDGFVDVTIVLPDTSTARLPHGFQFTALTRGFDIRRTPNVSISQQLNSQPYTAQITFDGRSNMPVIGERVSIIDSADSDRLLFSGSAIGVGMKFTDASDYEPDSKHLEYDASFVDDVFLLNSIFPIGNYIATSVTTIVQDLCSKNAPTFDCTTYVQTKLAAISITFDGTKGLFDCLLALTQALGGGHCYVDFQNKIHFFHIAPTTVEGVQGPQTLADPPVITVGVLLSTLNINSIYGAGVYGFLWTSEDGNGHESALSNISDLQFLDGKHLLGFDVPVNPDSATKRHLYCMRLVNIPYAIQGGDGPDTVVESYSALGDYGSAIRIASIQDNVTTAFNAYFENDVTAIEGISSVNVTPPDTSTIAPIPVTVRPQGPIDPPTLNLTVVTGENWWMGERLAVRVAFLYRNGTVSYYGPSSNEGVQPLIENQGVTGFTVGGIQTGPVINGVACIARIIAVGYPSNVNGSVDAFYNNPIGWGSTLGSVYVLPNNTDSVLVAKFPGAAVTSTGAFQLFDYYATILLQITNTAFGKANPAFYADALVTSEPVPIWPNPDGPNPEDTLPSPVDITDDDKIYLLRDTSPTYSLDGSQLRNRVTVSGAGSVLLADAPKGSLSLSVADVTAYSINGGTVLIDGRFPIAYNTPQLINAQNNGNIQLNTALPEAVSNGAPVVNYYQADDLVSQRLLAKVEKDALGNPTNGVHAYPINDSSLKAFFQLYMRAHAELELFSMPIGTFKYSTRDPLTRIGATVHVDLSYPPVYGDFLIQEVDTDQIHDDNDDLLPRRTVTATSVRYSLDDLLLALISSQQGQSSSSPSNGLSGITATVLDTFSTMSSSSNAVQIATFVDIDFTRRSTPIATPAGIPFVLVTGIPGFVIIPLMVTILAVKTNGVAWTNGSTNWAVRYTNQAIDILTMGSMGFDNTVLNHVISSRPANLNSGNLQSLTLTGQGLELYSGANLSGGSTAHMNVVIAYMTIPGNW